jgi:hypothetical protein
MNINIYSGNMVITSDNTYSYQNLMSTKSISKILSQKDSNTLKIHYYITYK